MRKWFLLAVLVLCAAPAFAQSSCLLTYQTEAIPVFFVDQHGEFQLEAVSGTPPYRFEVIDGVVPDGLQVKKDGRIKGTPREETENLVFIRLSDAAGCNLTQAFYLTVFP